MPRVLFICTANYYRSRFAEAVFNHLAAKRGSSWTAFSRGIVPEEAPPGLSPHAANGLRLAGVDPSFIPREKTPLCEADFDAAARVVALKREEHEPMLRERFGAFVGRVEFWNVSDVPLVSPPQAMLEIKENVEALLARLEESGGGPSPRAPEAGAP
ncbi:MAG: low molecular weight phosphatase family protein [Puniceicoccaceae bacterium]